MEFCLLFGVKLGPKAGHIVPNTVNGMMAFAISKAKLSSRVGLDKGAFGYWILTMGKVPIIIPAIAKNQCQQATETY